MDVQSGILLKPEPTLLRAAERRSFVRAATAIFLGGQKEHGRTYRILRSMDDPLAIKKPLVHGDPERRSMRDSFAKHVLVDIRVRIHVNKTDRTMLLLHRPQNRNGNRVIAAQRQRPAAM